MNPKNTFYGLITGVVLVVVSIGYSLFWANGQLKQKSTNIAELRAETTQLQVRINNAHKLSRDLDAIEDTLAIASEVLPNAKEQENIVGEILELAAVSGIGEFSQLSFNGTPISASTKDLNITQTESVAGSPGVYSLNISGSFNSSFGALRTLLSNIENNKRLFVVSSLSITPDDSTGTISAQIGLRTYIKP